MKLIMTNFNVDYYEIIYFFFIYAFMGWITEVIYAYYKNRCFINRGFLFGPLCPIYGTGAIMIIGFLYPVKNLYFTFLIGTILVSILEYIVGFILETMFNSKWWDYSDNKFNIHGRVCLGFSLLWGLAIVILVTVVHPRIETIIDGIPKNIGNVFLLGLVIYFLLDCTLTIISLVNLKARFVKLTNLYQEAKENYSEMLSVSKEKYSERFNSSKESLLSRLPNVDGVISNSKAKYVEIVNNSKETILSKLPHVHVEEVLKEFKEKYDKVVGEFNFNHKRLLRAYPAINPKKFEELIKELKEKLDKKI
ncbi:putative ABC transporter permease [Clostridium cellulovorans]|uniref:ABC transporter permease n=1 Tax=Clostridium cellulovorans (strain ATCC 35296 / DSM 3052 / OCM 3 / 743B) TaxID=573061 RepID=D9SLV9_CLOC7|nr:putative ABC transporter permease [Clostridium cellulovorans]ADL51690.1 protein of unknown function DUF1113 [Clostridium cellulovorans 743B]